MQRQELDPNHLERNTQVENALLSRWADHLEKIQISEHREPVINKEKLLALMEEAQATQNPLVFIALGCQDWIKPEWGDPDVDRIMGRIRPDDKRAKRFITEMASFSSSLRSLSIPHRIHFSLSDIEALLHIHLQNMGLTIHNQDASEIVGKNVSVMADKLLEHGVHVSPFIHSQVLAELLGANTLEEMQTQIAGTTEIYYQDFLRNLYITDIQKTRKHFVGEDGLGPVWLDIQSFNFTEDVTSLEQAARTFAPEMPILSIFPNAGNWHATHQPSVQFPSRDDLIAQMMGLSATPQSQAEWLKKLHKTRDDVLVEAFERFQQERPTITSGSEKTLAVRMFFQLAFNFDPLADQEIQ